MQNQQKMNEDSAGSAGGGQNEKLNMISLRRSADRDIAYIKNLARREIGRIPRRLHRHKTYLIFLNGLPIGFISYCRDRDNFLYIYMLALEKKAQNRGFARLAVRWMIQNENAKKPVRGIKARILKTNTAALYATQKKYGYKIIGQLPGYYILTRPVRPETDYGS